MLERILPYLPDFLIRYIQKKSILRYLAELDEEYGPVPPEILAEARAEWEKLHGPSSRSTAAR